MAIDFHQF